MNNTLKIDLPPGLNTDQIQQALREWNWKYQNKLYQWEDLINARLRN